jgi:hypothetical protein
VKVADVPNQPQVALRRDSPVCNDLASVLSRAGKPLEEQIYPDGSRLLLLPYGARVLGLFTPSSDENFFWTHPALASAESAQAFFQTSDWHNSGGDRTWLAPEVDIFFPNFPDTSIWRVPAELDPGHYATMGTGPTLQFVSQLTLTLSRRQERVEARIVKSWGPAPNPLRHEPRWKELSGVAYVGYTQETSLELLTNSDRSAQVGLWNLLALPHGGDVIIPTNTQDGPRVYAGPISPADLVTTDHLICFRMQGTGIRKIGIRAAASTGRFGYLYPSREDWALVVRNFTINPSGEYIDVPWAEPTSASDLVYSTQACSVNNDLGAYCELEYHAPAIGANTGHTRSCDTSQVWAYRGSRDAIQRVARSLLSAHLWLE